VGKYSIGLDFGTLSARAIVVDVENGKEMATSVVGYQDAVFDKVLPGTRITIPEEFALQNPQDYIDALESLLSDVWKKAKIKAEDIIGIGVASTSSSVICLDDKYHPLCFNERYKNNPHSWIKLWKHHGAQEEADMINDMVNVVNGKLFEFYGGKTNSENFFAKILETARKAPEIYDATYRFMEIADWIVYLLTGNDVRNSCMAGFKAFWNKDNKCILHTVFSKLSPRFDNVLSKISDDVGMIGGKAGGLTKEMSQKISIPEGVAVSLGNADGHLAVPAVGVTKPNTMVLIMGTSISHMILSDKAEGIPGICGVVEDGIIPGFFAYEAGQSAGGDIYDWFVSKIAPYEFMQQAIEKNVTIFKVLDAKAGQIQAGTSGVLALDWWNGNRSTLGDSRLSGVLLGLNINTKPEEIYKALIESTAFGTRLIVEVFENYGVQVKSIVACGGLSQKSSVVIQTFSDILNKPIKVSAVSQTTALGAAMYGAVAAGAANNGYDSIIQAAQRMSKLEEEEYRPNSRNVEIYNKLYKNYKSLYNLLGKNFNSIMWDLKTIYNKH